MKIWLVKASEPLPLDPQVRLMRMGMIAETLAARGHEVTWWCSSFDHFEKEYKSDQFKLHQIASNYKLAILHSPTPYYKNVSLNRIKNHRQLANSFKNIYSSYPQPDLIICSYPTIELAYESVKIGRKLQIPVIVDIRDMWPDIFLRALPKPLKPLGKPLLWTMNRQAKYIFKNATSLMGMTESFVEWGRNKVHREKRSSDIIAPFAYNDQTPDPQILEQANLYWVSQGIKNDDFVICFFGTLGKQFDIETVITAAQKIDNSQVKFVICGNGEFLEQYRNMAPPNMIFPGRVDKNQIYSLLRLSKLGLAPYKNNPDFLASIPNKIAEYLSAGLPILSSLKGEVKLLLDNHNCGQCYESAEELTQLINSLEETTSERISWSKNAHNLYNESFNAQVVYRELADKIEHLQKEYSCN